MIQHALIIANIAMGLLLAILEIGCYRVSCDPMRWLRLFSAGIGIFWALFYFIMWISGPEFDPAPYQIWIRPGITVTLAAMASSSIIRARRV